MQGPECEALPSANMGVAGVGGGIVIRTPAPNAAVLAVLGVKLEPRGRDR